MDIRDSINKNGYFDKFPDDYYFSLKGLVLYYWLANFEVEFLDFNSTNQPSQDEIDTIVEIIKEGFLSKKIITYNFDLLPIFPKDWGYDYIFSAKNIIDFFRKEYSQNLKFPGDDVFFYILDLDFRFAPLDNYLLNVTTRKGLIRAERRSKGGELVDDFLEHYFNKMQSLPKTHMDLIRYAMKTPLSGYDRLHFKNDKLHWHDGEAFQSCQTRQIKDRYSEAKERNSS